MGEEARDHARRGDQLVRHVVGIEQVDQPGDDRRVRDGQRAEVGRPEVGLRVQDVSQPVARLRDEVGALAVVLEHPACHGGVPRHHDHVALRADRRRPSRVVQCHAVDPEDQVGAVDVGHPLRVRVERCVAHHHDLAHRLLLGVRRDVLAQLVPLHLLGGGEFRGSTASSCQQRQPAGADSPVGGDGGTRRRQRTNVSCTRRCTTAYVGRSTATTSPGRSERGP